MGISVLEMRKRLKRVATLGNLERLVDVEIRKNESELITYKKQEYEVGNIYGEPDAKATYSMKSRVKKKGKELYRNYKNKINPKAGLGNVDLILTGDFINSFKLLPKKNDKYLFDATDDKKDELEATYGNIFGMTDVHFQDFLKTFVADDFRKAIKKQLSL